MPEKMKRRLGGVLPRPPTQELRIPLRHLGEVHRATQGVEHAAVHRATLERAQPRVQLLRIPPLELPDTVDAQQVQVGLHGRTDAWDPA